MNFSKIYCHETITKVQFYNAFIDPPNFLLPVVTLALSLNPRQP